MDGYYMDITDRLSPLFDRTFPITRKPVQPSDGGIDKAIAGMICDGGKGCHAW